MARNIRLDLFPIALVIPDFFATGADRQQAAQRLHAGQGLLQLLDELVAFGFGLVAVGDIQHGGAALPPALGNHGLDVNKERSCLRFQECHLAEFPVLSRKSLCEEGVEDGLVRLGNQNPKAPVQELGALDAKEAGAGEIDGKDGSVSGKVEVARRGEVVEVGVLDQERLRPGARPLEFLVLHLQLDLVDFQFVDEPRRFQCCLLPSAFRPLALQPLFGAAAQLGGVRGLVLVLLHGLLSFWV